MEDPFFKMKQICAICLIGVICEKLFFEDQFLADHADKADNVDY